MQENPKEKDLVGLPLRRFNDECNAFYHRS